MKRNLTWLILITFLFIMSCQFFTNLVPRNEDFEAWPSIVRQSFVIPDEDYSEVKFWNLVWTRSDRILVFIEKNNNNYYLNEDDIFEEISLREFPHLCSRATWYWTPEELPDGRISWVMYCNSFLLPNSLGDEGVWRQVFAFDLETGEQDQIIPENLPRIVSYKVSWNPAGSEGIVSAGSTDGTLYWVDETGSSPIDLTIGTAPRSWNLQDSYLFLNADDNPDIGIASDADWSHDGQTIAFFASIDSLSKIGFEKAESEYQLYFLDVNTMEYRTIFSGVYDPSELQWAPNGKYIAFVAHLNSFESEATLWVYSLEKGVLYKLENGYFPEIDWSPDSDQIITLKCLSVPCKQPEIVIFDLFN
jgi:WD40 repeat protein